MLPYQFIAAECDRESLFNSIELCKPKNNINGPRNITFMGEMVSVNANGMYYLETNESPPYGRGNYLVD